MGGMTNGERKAWLTLLKNLGDYFTEEGQLESYFAGGIELPGRQSVRAHKQQTLGSSSQMKERAARLGCRAGGESCSGR